MPDKITGWSHCTLRGLAAYDAWSEVTTRIDAARLPFLIDLASPARPGGEDGGGGQGDDGHDIDAFHDEFGIVVEVEAGRAASNNATYRDIIRASLILDANYLVLLLPVIYRFNNRGQLASVAAFTRGLDLLSALYASQRLPLSLRGVLLVGY